MTILLQSTPNGYYGTTSRSNGIYNEIHYYNYDDVMIPDATNIVNHISLQVQASYQYPLTTIQPLVLRPYYQDRNGSSESVGTTTTTPITEIVTGDAVTATSFPPQHPGRTIVTQRQRRNSDMNRSDNGSSTIPHDTRHNSMHSIQNDRNNENAMRINPTVATSSSSTTIQHPITRSHQKQRSPFGDITNRR